MQTVLFLTTLTLFSTIAVAQGSPKQDGVSICLSVFDYSTGHVESNLYWLAFAAGTACSETGSKDSRLNTYIGEDLCEIMDSGRHAYVGSTELDFSNAGPNIKTYGCGAQLLVNGKKYDGRLVSEKDEDICSQSCANKIGPGAMLGLKIYEHVILDSPQSNNNGGQAYQVGKLPSDTAQGTDEGASQELVPQDT